MTKEPGLPEVSIIWVHSDTESGGPLGAGLVVNRKEFNEGKSESTQDPDLTMETDDWGTLERRSHIYYLELLAGWFRVREFAKDTRNIHIHLKMDSMWTAWGTCSMWTAWGTCSAATVVYKQVSTLISEKRGHSYSQTLFWIRCKLSFSLIHSEIMCVRGSRSHHLCQQNMHDPAIDLAWSVTVCLKLIIVPSVLLFNDMLSLFPSVDVVIKYLLSLGENNALEDTHAEVSPANEANGYQSCNP